MWETAPRCRAGDVPTSPSRPPDGSTGANRPSTSLCRRCADAVRPLLPLPPPRRAASARAVRRRRPRPRQHHVCADPRGHGWGHGSGAEGSRRDCARPANVRFPPETDIGRRVWASGQVCGDAAAEPPRMRHCCPNFAFSAEGEVGGVGHHCPHRARFPHNSMPEPAVCRAHRRRCRMPSEIVRPAAAAPADRSGLRT